MHHRHLVATHAGLDPDELDKRAWTGLVRRFLHDLHAPGCGDLHDAEPQTENHTYARAFGKMLRAEDSWGIVY